MDASIAVPVWYIVVFWLAKATIDLVVAVARGPLTIAPILELVVALLCLIVVVWRLAHHGWLLSG